jgi:hypothetical protein
VCFLDTKISRPPFDNVGIRIEGYSLLGCGTPNRGVRISTMKAAKHAHPAQSR